MAVDTNVEVKLKNVRLSFEHIFKAQIPKPDKDGKVGEASFNAAFLFSKDDVKTKNMILDAIDDCKALMWPKDPPKIRSDRQPLQDGDERDYDGYADHWFISARNRRAPKVVHSKKDEDGKFVKLDGSEGVIYSGCMVNAIIRFWAQDSKDYGKRVNASLEVVQFYADNDAFSGASQVDPDEALAGMEGKVDDDDDPRSDRGRRTEREARRSREDDSHDSRGSRRDREEDRRSNGRSDERSDEGDRRSRSRDDGEDRGGRSSRSRDEGERDRETRSSRRDDDERSSDRRSSSSRGEDRRGDREETSGRRGRDDRDDDAGSSRRRDRDDDDRGSRRRSSDLV